jgi:heme exporter protein C
MSLIELATPSRFIALSARLMPWLIALTVLAFLIGGIEAYLAPDDYQQGATGRSCSFTSPPPGWELSHGW